MKPIFKEEKDFFESKAKIILPDNCWMDGQKIYLNCDDPFPVITYTVITLTKEIKIKKNLIKETKDNKVHIQGKYRNKKYDEWWINLTLDEEVKKHDKRLMELESKSLIEIMCCIQYYTDYEFRLSDSSGKDSAVCSHIFKKAMKKLNRCDYEIDFFNTSNDTADTYIKIKKNIREHIKFILEILLEREVTIKEIEDFYKEKEFEWIHNPKVGWYQWLKDDKKYLLPSVMMRNCCNKYKEGGLNELLDKDKKYVLFLGMRKYESSKRSEYNWYLNDAMNEIYIKTGKNKYKLNVPKNWIRFLPIVEWEDRDVWLYMIKERIEFNPMYSKGFNRVGCLQCPYASNYNYLLICHWYPMLQERWDKITEKNYEIWRIERTMKWSLKEWQSEKWKQSTSKTQEIIQKKATPKRIKELSNLLGVSENTAKKYFQKTCSCGKKLNPGEIGMFLKTMGRFEGVDDSRQYLCKNCLCDIMGWTKNDYKERYIQYSEQGCNLF